VPIFFEKKFFSLLEGRRNEEKGGYPNVSGRETLKGLMIVWHLGVSKPLESLPDTRS